MTELIKEILTPTSLIGLFSVFGIVCLVWRKTRGLATRFLFTGGLAYLVFGNGPVSFYLIHSLENQYRAFSSELPPDAFGYIVVLTGHALADGRLPASSTVNSSSAFRVLEAFRLHRAFPDARIFISGYDDVPRLMKGLLLELGMGEESILLDIESRSTYESAVHVKGRIRESDFLLVTSAGHMPRSLKVFNALGMNPTPAATDYLAKMSAFGGSFLPSPEHLLRTDLAVHEYLGLFWYRLTGRL